MKAVQLQANLFMAGPGVVAVADPRRREVLAGTLLLHAGMVCSAMICKHADLVKT